MKTRILLTLIVIACLTMTAIRLRRAYNQLFEVKNVEIIH